MPTLSHATIDQMHVRTRTAPICYSRQPTSVTGDEPSVDERSNAVVAVLSAVTCAATFLVVYGGWGL